MSPQMSVVLAALDDYSVVEQVHLCLEAQTIRADLELIFVCRSRADLLLPGDFEDRYPDVKIVEGGATILLNEARELGVHQTTTPFVLILEDHCLPFASCLQKMLTRLEEGWSAVGPALVSGNTESSVAIAANLLTYGQWMGWTEGGERTFVSGFNSAFPTRVLLARGDRLTTDLVTPSTLQMSLAREGHRFFFEARAVMAHWEASNYAGLMQILTKNGRGLGHFRARQWPLPTKVFATLLIPVLMGFRVSRAAGAWWRSGYRSSSVLLQVLPLAILWTVGELRGYWSRDPRAIITGAGDVERNRQRYVDDSLEPIRKPY